MLPSSCDGSAKPGQLLATAREMTRTGLTSGSAGNLSVRDGEGMWITPSGMTPEACREEDMVWMDFDGRSTGSLTPSSEWRFHANLYRRHDRAGAILHAHSPFATALACQRIDIPAFHYMIARFGGDSVRCAPYATFGSERLSQYVCEAMRDRCACLLANHGMAVYGCDLPETLALAQEFETLCEQYWRTLQLGPPVLLSAEEISDALSRFSGYGRPQRTAAG